MKKTKVILVRHGETEWNASCKFLGMKDIPLNEKGKRQAEYARNALKSEQIDVIYSSPMVRAYETGEIIRGDRSIDIIVDTELREINCGMWEGLDGTEVEKLFPGQIYLWANRPEECKIKGGDTFREVSERMIKEFWKIVRENKGKTILITSHMISITLLMLDFVGKGIGDIWNVKTISNAALNIIEVSEDERIEIIAWSDDSFIPNEEKKGSALVAGRHYVKE